jgi:hypothetical protein
MLEILKYIFSSIWIFIGTIVLIYCIGSFTIVPICKTILGSIAIKYDRHVDID